MNKHIKNCRYKIIGGITIKNILKLGAIFAITITFTFCSCTSSIKQSTQGDGQGGQSTQVQAPVKIPNTKEIVNTLCSDEFQGRLTGSKGNEKAGEYIAKIFKDIGLDTLFENSYYEKYSQKIASTYRGDEKNAKTKTVNNVVGVIRGKDSKKAVIISAHFDHLGYVNGKINRGALDNASGVSALIEIAHILKEKSKDKPFNMDIVLCAFNGEEEFMEGSRAFVQDIKSKHLYSSSLYNINIDCIGAKNAGKNLALHNENRLSEKLYDAVESTFKKNNISFSNSKVQGLSDHFSFQAEGIPNIFIVQENIEKLANKPTDTPDILDYDQIDKIANAICDFVEANDGVEFPNWRSN